MPTYVCTAPKDLLNAKHKSAIAKAVTTAHADVTGAPEFFAQVIFHDVSDGDFFIGGAPLAHDHIFIYGRIRGGRSGVDRKTLIKRIVTETSDAVGVSSFAIWVYLLELPAAAMAEFGHILPEPGDDANWNNNLPDDDRARMQAIGTKK